MGVLNSSGGGRNVLTQAFQGLLGSLCTLVILGWVVALMLDGLPGHKGRLTQRYTNWVMGLPVKGVKLLMGAIQHNIFGSKGGKKKKNRKK